MVCGLIQPIEAFGGGGAQRLQQVSWAVLAPAPGVKEGAGVADQGAVFQSGCSSLPAFFQPSSLQVACKLPSSNGEQSTGPLIVHWAVSHLQLHALLGNAVTRINSISRELGNSAQLLCVFLFIFIFHQGSLEPRSTQHHCN